ncbi:hypothetical protein LOK49_LG06G02707 [Camellia lanceoleosa]|uniref:Uncharacterized protein n=1 Tax=Camellia lanceoleosa TaxID=1840588 RepID=A0ACC0HEP1_9ERIC|nr:hypothetical protein LOK49_LG06G02707 [Camellia lanceoleosa]
MVHHLEEPPILRSLADFIDDLPSPDRIFVNASKVYDWKIELGIVWIGGFVEIVWWLNENFWDSGNPSINKSFDTSFGVIKSL